MTLAAPAAAHARDCYYLGSEAQAACERENEFERRIEESERQHQKRLDELEKRQQERIEELRREQEGAEHDAWWYAQIEIARERNASGR